MGRIALVLILACAAWCCAWAQPEPYLGRWRTVDENSGTTMVMEILVENDRLRGRVVQVLDRLGREINPVCDPCAGSPHVRGMLLVRDLKWDGAKWIEGRVVDLRPGLTQGFEARCELQIENGRLRLFGYKWDWAKSWANGVAYWDRHTAASAVLPEAAPR